MKLPTRSNSPFSFARMVNPHLISLILLVIFSLAIQACKSSSNKTGTDVPPDTSSGASQLDELDQEMTLDQALTVNLEDNREQVLRQMGPPDVFKITFQDLNGTRVRQEEWSYFDDQSRFDFINGALLWTIDLASVPDTSVNASTYDPLTFTDGMTVDEVQSLLSDQQLMQVELADYGVPGGLVMAGDQILLGFEAGKLVSVRTFELVQGVAQ